VTAGQSFYFKTSAASSLGSVGAYGLLVNFGSSTQSPIAPPNTVVLNQPDQGGGSENIGSGGTPGGDGDLQGHTSGGGGLSGSQSSGTKSP